MIPGDELAVGILRGKDASTEEYSLFLLKDIPTFVVLTRASKGLISFVVGLSDSGDIDRNLKKNENKKSIT